MKIIVTGATGYIGQTLLRSARARGCQLAIYARQPIKCDDITVLSYGSSLPDAFRGADALINLAGRAHTTAEADGHDTFEEVNHQLPLRLAKMALAADVRRFVHVSSIGVHGNTSSLPLTEATPMAADTAYSRSKAAAELALQDMFSSAPHALTIVRPPMVYGPACPGNFSRLLKLIRTGLPLPFGAIDARRSFIFVDNLADFLLHCALHQNGDGTYLIADGSDYAVPQLLRAIGQELNRPVRLFSVPPKWLRGAAHLIGRQREMDSLTRPLIVDWNHAHKTLRWTPPVDPGSALHLSVT